jgi:HAD superfamily phosphatase (TIGR01668 family)
MKKRHQKDKRRGLLLLNYFKPTIYLKSVHRINLDLLRGIGIKAIICDMDNTLLGWNERIPSKTTIDFIKNVRHHGMEFILFSNNIKSRVENFAEKAGINNYFWDCKKPLLSKIKILKKILPYKEQEMIIVGDQLVTDVLVANRAHIKSILVEPISRVDGGSKIIGFFERWINKKLAQKNILHDGFYNEDELGGQYEIL